MDDDIKKLEEYICELEKSNKGLKLENAHLRSESELFKTEISEYVEKPLRVTGILVFAQTKKVGNTL